MPLISAFKFINWITGTPTPIEDGVSSAFTLPVQSEITTALDAFLKQEATAVFGASGANHSVGLVPDPGSVAGTTRFLREDSSFAVPPAPTPTNLIPHVTRVTATGGGTYNVPANTVYLYVLARGAGGGGAGTGATAASGTDGGSTTFTDSSIVSLTAGGGAKGQPGNVSGSGGAGGTATGGDFNFPGQQGNSTFNLASSPGGDGGPSPTMGVFGTHGAPANNGGAAPANSGGGGGGGGSGAANPGGNGGGGGGCVVIYITSSLASSYTYSVGAKGTGGGGAFSGGNGADGELIVIAYVST